MLVVASTSAGLKASELTSLRAVAKKEGANPRLLVFSVVPTIRSAPNDRAGAIGLSLRFSVSVDALQDCTAPVRGWAGNPRDGLLSFIPLTHTLQDIDELSSFVLYSIIRRARQSGTSK
jgi:hypothetical protein